MSFSFQFPSTSSPITTLSNSVSTSSSPSNSIFCRRRCGQVIELNFTNLSNIQVNLIETTTSSPSSANSNHFSPSKFLYSLKSWPVGSTPKKVICNSLGNLVAIQGSSGNVSVLRLEGSSSTATVITEEIEIEQSSLLLQCTNFTDFVEFSWHPASPADHHLVILCKSGKLFMFDLLKAVKDGGRGSFNDEIECFPVSLLRLSEPEQIIKLPTNRTDPFSSICFVDNCTESSWLPFTAFLIKESGDIFALCPFVPLKFKAQRQNHLLPLSRNESDPVVLRWLDDIIRSCEFVANSTGNTDWVLATCPPSFFHLQPLIQGPFLIQPEPMEIHQLASYDRVADFIVSSVLNVNNLNEPAFTCLAVAFGSGKVDFLALVSEIIPKFQLKDSLIKSSNETDLLPILTLIESVDVKGSEGKSANRRSIDNQIKFLKYPATSSYFLVSSDTSIIKIDLGILCEYPQCNHEEEESNNEPEYDCSIQCQSTILIEKLKSHAQCISEKQIYPGAIKLDENLESTNPDQFESPSHHVRESSILETITKFAFPLGKMEIEGGAVQLESLLENLTKTLQRLKGNRSISSKTKLPEIDEIGATEFNDHVSEWQESLVSPAIRFGHEISLRSNELVQILRREREILVRAKTLLTAKPERLEKLLKTISESKIRNQKLMERLLNTSKELSKHSFYDSLLIEKLSEISNNLRSHHPVQNEEHEFVLLENEEELIQAQLAIQTEKLLKLKNQLKNN